MGDEEIAEDNEAIAEANPTSNGFIVILDSNGGEGNLGVSTTQEISSGSKAAKPTADPTRFGYTFGGWVVDGSSPEKIWNFDDAVTEDMTLKAKWVARQITVKFVDSADSYFDRQRPLLR